MQRSLFNCARGLHYFRYVGVLARLKDNLLLRFGPPHGASRRWRAGLPQQHLSGSDDARVASAMKRCIRIPPALVFDHRALRLCRQLVVDGSDWAQRRPAQQRGQPSAVFKRAQRSQPQVNVLEMGREVDNPSSDDGLTWQPLRSGTMWVGGVDVKVSSWWNVNAPDSKSIWQ